MGRKPANEVTEDGLQQDEGQETAKEVKVELVEMYKEGVSEPIFVHPDMVSEYITKGDWRVSE